MKAETRQDLACILTLLAATLVYALVVVQYFGGPLIGVDDANGMEHYSFLFDGQLTLGVPPRIEFAPTKAVLYPFGTLVVFLPWGPERDLWYVLFHRGFGDGPWLQLYQTVSVAVSSCATYFLLRRDYGAVRALLVAFAGTFMNFYAVYKYPHHMNVAVMHWAIASVVVDFLIFQRFVTGRRWSTHLLLARIALLPALFGLDLGYVTGFALLSGATTVGGMLVWLAVERWRGRNALANAWPTSPLRDLRARPVATVLLSTILVVSVAFYVPLAVQIVQVTKTFKFEGPGGSFWANQLRILFPYLPGIHPASPLVERLFGHAEGTGEFSTGWALLVVAGLGLRDAYRERRLVGFVPILVAFVLAFAYHPRHLPSLRIFPWFQFNRVAGRATLVFPIWFALVGLGWRPAFDRGRVRKGVAALGLLAAIETTTAHAAISYRAFRPDASFWGYMKTVREAPGEAVLDWPFCIAGGNGVATKDLCPYYALTSTTFAYRRFHRKNVVGLLLARMTMSQAKPFYDLGLPSLFTPDHPEIRTARRQTRCFDDREMEIFESFFNAHDFAGISLYTDLLPPGCAERFYDRFGPPVAETRLPAEGRAVFVRVRADGSLRAD
ncbi:MAG TPA: hypothetical protein VM580_23275 [Labilithrix sp.]|nr:hypothetical protein [Labilithrix sp.]